MCADLTFLSLCSYYLMYWRDRGFTLPGVASVRQQREMVELESAWMNE